MQIIAHGDLYPSEKGSQTLHNLSDKHVIQDAVSFNTGRIISGLERNGIKDEICQI